MIDANYQLAIKNPRGKSYLPQYQQFTYPVLFRKLKLQSFKEQDFFFASLEFVYASAICPRFLFF